MDQAVRIGFLGVGLMGHGAAKNIMERGELSAHRPRPPQPQPVDDLVGARRDGGEGRRALAAASDVVVRLRPSSVEVEAAFHGPRRLSPARGPA